MAKEKEPGCIKFQIVCRTCQKVLYETDEANFITSHVASMTIKGHLEAFSRLHHITATQFLNPTSGSSKDIRSSEFDPKNPVR